MQQQQIRSARNKRELEKKKYQKRKSFIKKEN